MRNDSNLYFTPVTRVTFVAGRFLDVAPLRLDIFSPMLTFYSRYREAYLASSRSIYDR